MRSAPTLRTRLAPLRRPRKNWPVLPQRAFRVHLDDDTRDRWSFCSHLPWSSPWVVSSRPRRWLNRGGGWCNHCVSGLGIDCWPPSLVLLKPASRTSRLRETQTLVIARNVSIDPLFVLGKIRSHS